MSFVVIAASYLHFHTTVRSVFQNLRLRSIRLSLSQYCKDKHARCMMIFCGFLCQNIARTNMRYARMHDGRRMSVFCKPIIMLPKRRFWNVEKYSTKAFCKHFSYSRLLYLTKSDENYITFMVPKRRFWKDEQKMNLAFSRYFSLVRSPNRVLTPLKRT